MLKDIKSNKFKCNEGYYMMVLKIPEKLVYSAYSEADDETLREITAWYLNFIHEEGKPRNIAIEKLKDNSYIVEMQLIYYDMDI